MNHREPATKKQTIGEISLLMLLFFVYAGDLAPMVNEAHYLVKAKNFWDTSWCQNDLFAASGKAHTTFYFLFGWPTKFLSFNATAWIGRVVGWLLLAIGLQRLSSKLVAVPFASLAVATLWIVGIEQGNLAGEWVVGGIEAKVPAYGFVLLALSAMVDRRWNRVWILLGVASAFHVLSGGWSVIAASLVWLMTEKNRSDRKAFFAPALFAGGAIALLGLVPALWLTVGVPREDSVAAAEIYTYYRIKHHLLPADFQTWWFVRHGILIVATGVLYFLSCKDQNARDGFGSLFWFTVGAVAIAAIGLVVGMLPPYTPDLAAKLLRYYWFRLTDAIVPLMFALLVVRQVFHKREIASKTTPTTICGLFLLAGIVLFAGSSFQRFRLGIPPSASHKLLGWAPNASIQQQRDGFADWLAVCEWVRGSTPADEILLTPRHQQSFKWYAHRAEVVNWKDVPQDAKSLLEWNRRFAEIFPRRLRRTRVTIKYSALRDYREKYGVRLMVVDRRITGPNLPLVRVYPAGEEINATYAVYELPLKNETN
ncbi:MAG: DUF6798 domain-containing protein [Pirellulaceae bacterium]